MYLETRSVDRIPDNIKRLIIAAFLLDDNLARFELYQSDLGLLHLHNVIGGRGHGAARRTAVVSSGPFLAAEGS